MRGAVPVVRDNAQIHIGGFDLDDRHLVGVRVHGWQRRGAGGSGALLLQPVRLREEILLPAAPGADGLVKNGQERQADNQRHREDQKVASFQFHRLFRFEPYVVTRFRSAQFFGERFVHAIGDPTINFHAQQEGADYLGVGPVFATQTKRDRSPAGLSWVVEASRHATVPWFAIGGIDAETIASVRAAGAQRVAVVSAVMASNDPEEASRTLLEPLT